LRAEELPRFAAVTPPLQDVLALGSEFLNPVPFAVFGDIVIPFGILQAIGHAAELARFLPRDAADGPILEQLPFRRVTENACVMRVRNQQVAIVAKGETRGFAVGELRRLPAAEILAVGRKDGNPRRDINDVEVVVLIDRNRPRLLELAGSGSRPAPNGIEPP